MGAIGVNKRSETCVRPGAPFSKAIDLRFAPAFGSDIPRSRHQVGEPGG
jgi:hypothetical protein